MRFDNLLDISMSILPEMRDIKKKHFTFILDKTKVLSVGINRPRKTHPLAARYGYRYSDAHSELDAVLRLPRNIDFNRLRLINVRLSGLSLKVGIPILRKSRPCPKCLPWILGYGFKDVIYTVDQGFISLKNEGALLEELTICEGRS